jgi:hypothetical protein
MRQDDAPATLPPRPNLGPEPWPETPPLSAWWWWLLAVAVLAVAAARILRRSRRGRNRAPSTPDHAEPAQRTPAERLIALARMVRESMADRVGPSWQARTTEEMAESLKDVDPAVRESVIRLLLAADRAKFAGGSVDDDHLGLAEEWAAEALAGLRAAGASSIQNGR